MMQKEEAKQKEIESGYKIKIVTWNTWSIFVSSPRCLSNPYRCCDYILNIADTEKWLKFDGLIVCAFQELWKWNTGFIPSQILSHFVYLVEYIPYIGSIISRIFQILTLVIGAIPIFKLIKSFNYCPKNIVINKFKKICPYFYYNNTIPILPIYKISDNGLLLLFNYKPDITGSQQYKCSYGECSMVSKGFIYSYFKKYHTLFVMTHIQYTGPIAIKQKQLYQIVEFIRQFNLKYNQQNKINMKNIVFGDFNCDFNKNNPNMAENEKVNPIDILGNDYKKINSTSATTWDHKCIDHVFINHDFIKYNEQIVAKSKETLSDHWCLITDFYSK